MIPISELIRNRENVMAKFVSKAKQRQIDAQSNPVPAPSVKPKKVKTPLTPEQKAAKAAKKAAKKAAAKAAKENSLLISDECAIT
jgi:hypothetical protein